MTAPVRTVSVAANRLAGWLEGFADRHGDPEVSLGDGFLRLASPDGAEASIEIPFPPLVSQADVPPLDAVLAHVRQSRRVAALLVRKGGYAVGVFEGDRLVTSKVGSSYVQGRTKAGGWSQQRYSRRRDNQSRHAYQEAADQAARVLLPEVERLDAVVGGGDRTAVLAVLADRRLERLRALLQARVHPVPDPRLRVLQAFPELFLAVPIQLNELA